MNRPISTQVTYRKIHKQTFSKVASFLLLSMFVGTFFTQSATAAFFELFAREVVSESTDVLVSDYLSSQDVVLLQGARNIDPNPSRGGGEVSVADSVALVAENAPFNSVSEEQVAPASSDQISLYLVQEGDTLSQVAQMFNVSVNTVVWANELSSNKDIHPGQTLLILPISGVQHVVKKGDTVKTLAKKYGGDIEEIIAYNNLAGDNLIVGDTVTIPGGEIEEEKKPVNATYTKVVSSTQNTSGYFIHPLPGSVRTQGIHGYNALDFGAPAGTPVRAAAGGKVIVSRVGGWNGGYGNYIVIEHPNGTQTLYSHNSKNTVWQGQAVVQGQVIGYVGSTGRSTGNHLHFEVRGAKNPF